MCNLLLSVKTGLTISVESRNFAIHKEFPPNKNTKAFTLNETWVVCQERFYKTNVDEKIIFIVTPTYPRPEQVAELTRLLQTLIHVKEVIHWIIAIDRYILFGTK